MPQMGIDDMKNSFHLNTKLLGLIGYPIKQTFSPLMHNVAAELLGLDYMYLPFSVHHSDLKESILGMKSLGFRGFNVTIPHKESVVQYLSSVSEEASIIGAVNCVVIEDGNLVGYNTDALGIYETLNPYLGDIQGKEVTVFGAGGAARAAIFTLIRHFKPSRIHLINRTTQRAESLMNYFSTNMRFSEIKVHDLFPPEIAQVVAGSGLVINTTSLGMNPEPEDTPFDQPDSFRKGQIVFDMVYNPAKTKFLSSAVSEGATGIDGINMLVAQGAKAFELWTGEKMPVQEIYDTIQKYLNP